jgi:hypothetical protein
VNYQPLRDPASIRVSTPEQFLAVIPLLLGYQPHDCLILVGVAPPAGRVTGIISCAFPDPADPATAACIARDARDVLAAQGATVILAAGYGPGPLVTPLADALRAYCGEPGPVLGECLRVHEGRYWSYLCPGTCHPGEGTVPPAAVLPAQFVARAQAAATFDSLAGAAASQMAAETRRCERIALAYITRAGAAPGTAQAARVLAGYGAAAVTAIIRVYRDRGPVPAASAFAWLCVVLRVTEVRDSAWTQMDPRYADDHLRLWTDLVRRAQPGYIAAPAAMLAFTAWQSGDIPLAHAALDRAQADNPDYSLARLLRDVISAGVPPSGAVLPRHPRHDGDELDQRPADGTGPHDGIVIDRHEHPVTANIAAPGFIAELADVGSTHCLRVVRMPDSGGVDDDGRRLHLDLVMGPVTITGPDPGHVKSTAGQMLVAAGWDIRGSWSWDEDDRCYWTAVAAIQERT